MVGPAYSLSLSMLPFWVVCVPAILPPAACVSHPLTHTPPWRMGMALLHLRHSKRRRWGGGRRRRILPPHRWGQDSDHRGDFYSTPCCACSHCTLHAAHTPPPATPPYLPPTMCAILMPGPYELTSYPMPLIQSEWKTDDRQAGKGRGRGRRSLAGRLASHHQTT